MKRIKALLATIGIISFSLLPMVGLAQVAGAVDINTDKTLCSGVEFENSPNTSCVAQEGSKSLASIAKTVINIFSWVVGIVSVIMIIVGGFKYVTSGGNDSAVSSAKSTIMYAIIGLVVVALAQVIVRFVLVNLDKSGTT